MLVGKNMGGGGGRDAIVRRSRAPTSLKGSEIVRLGNVSGIVKNCTKNYAKINKEPTKDYKKTTHILVPKNSRPENKYLL
jgi:hypothetical protein